MAKKVTWDDAAEIGILLSQKYPDLNPFDTELNDLHRYVTELAEFEGDRKIFSGEKLEAIREAWNIESLDRTQ
jgi:FeS assembly protein IscX